MKMEELAKLAGVTKSTVSKAFSGSKGVSAEQRERIFKLAEEYGCYDKFCKPNYNGVVVAVICLELRSRSWSEQLSFFSKKITERGAVMVTGSVEFDRQKIGELVDFFANNVKVSGIVLMFSDNDVIEKKLSTPVVVLGESENYTSIRVSEEKASVDAIKLLKDNGHRKIAYIGQEKSKIRINNFRKAMELNGIPLDEKYMFIGDNQAEVDGLCGMNELLDMSDRPTALVVSNDNIAIGAIKSIYQHGLKIPEDISIIGNGDIREAPYLYPSLTTITSYDEDLVDIALDTLFEAIEKKDSTFKKQIMLRRELIIRDSVGKVKETE